MFSAAVEQRCHQLMRGITLLSLTLLIFINPFPHISALNQMLFYTALVPALFLLLIRTPKPDFGSPLGLPFLFFLLWAFASTIWAFDWKNTLHDVYGHLLKHLILYCLLIAFFTRREQFLALIWSFIASTTLFSLGAIIYYFISAHPISFRLDFLNIGYNQIAQFCMFGTLLSLFYFPMVKKWPGRALLSISLITTLSVVILTCSRASLLSLAIGGAFLLFTHQYRKPLIIAALSVFTALIFIYNISPYLWKSASVGCYIPKSNDERIIIYATDYEMIKDKPFAGFGYGAESFKKNYFKFNKALSQKFASQIDYAHPHNVFLDIAIRLGLVGLTLFCWILFRVFKMGRELIIRGKDPFIRQWGTGITACLIAFLTAGLFGNILNSRNAVILYSIMAMITILWKLQKSEEESFTKQSELKNKGFLQNMGITSPPVQTDTTGMLQR